MNNKLLYTTRELFDSYLRGRYFSIPAYQRGYKWESKDIERLLEDVNGFHPDKDLDLFYCLQNITLVETDKSYNVVDGQQRLTTLIILLAYFNEFELIRNKLEYNVREETGNFLKEYIFQPSNIQEINSWDNLLDIAAESGKDYDFQDIYYLFGAYKTIQRWFEEKSESALNEMKDKFLNHLKVIVNLPRNVDEQELFENLNGKRVPLDGADLIRALIITRVAKKEVGEISDSTKQNVLVNERRVKIGFLLDAMNLWWSDENRRTYFKQFTKEAKMVAGNSVTFDDDKYPINNIYKLYALAFADGRMSMDLFEKKSTEDEFLQELQLLQRTIENWYNDKLLYHLILFTGIYAADINKEKGLSRLSFKELISIWKQSTRLSFVNYLKERIATYDVFDDLMKQSVMSDEDNEKTAFSEDWYNAKLINVSVLLDIIHILYSPDDARLPAKYFKRTQEDLEHIFPQTPIGDRIKDKLKQTQILKQYVEIINTSVPDEKKIAINETEINWDNQEWKENIKLQINNAIESVIPIDSIGNMCLLHESVNKGYGNDFFLEKRIDVMRKSQEGYFIRPHVFEAFNKIFVKRQDSINMEQMIRWDRSDILSRRKYIIQRICNFLQTKNEQA